MTAQGSACARFRRALDSRNVTVALATATELDFVSLPDALELVLLLVDDPRRFRRAVLRWHARCCSEVPDVGFEEALVVLSCMGRPWRPEAQSGGRVASRSLIHHRGFRQAGEALLRWAR